MDDPVPFTTFITGVCNINTPRAQNEILGFANTFRALSNTTDEDLDNFVKETHSSNSARPANGKILIPASAVIALKSINFEIKDRIRCGAIPTIVMLNALNAAQIAICRTTRTNAMNAATAFRSSSLPDIEMPKFKEDKYEDFIVKFRDLIKRTASVHGGLSIEYLLRKTNGNYNTGGFVDRADKLRQCLRLTGPLFKTDSATLYSLYVQYVGTEGPGSNIINRFATSKDGYRCHHEFTAHYEDASFLENKASMARQAINNAKYYGERRTFTLDKYYQIMTTSFNDLEKAGTSYALNEAQKVTEFEGGLKNETALHWHLISRNAWKALPAHLQTFDAYYNTFSQYMSKFRTLSNTSSRTSQINQVNGRGRGRGGRGGRGRGGRGRGGRGRGRNGRGRGRGSYNPYSTARPIGTFTPEARIYDRDFWLSLTNEQKTAVQNLKVADGWVDSQTPPHGFVLDPNGYAVPNTRLVSAVTAMLAPTATVDASTIASNPAEAYAAPIVPPGPPPIIHTNASQAGNSFGRHGSASRAQVSATRTQAPVSRVSINGQAYAGPVFDAQGNRLN